MSKMEVSFKFNERKGVYESNFALKNAKFYNKEAMTIAEDFRDQMMKEGIDASVNEFGMILLGC